MAPAPMYNSKRGGLFANVATRVKISKNIPGEPVVFWFRRNDGFTNISTLAESRRGI